MRELEVKFEKVEGEIKGGRKEGGVRTMGRENLGMKMSRGRVSGEGERGRRKRRWKENMEAKRGG